MSMKRLFFNTLLLTALAAAPALAEPETPIDFKGIYEFGLGGIPLGRMGLEAVQTADHYSGTCDLMSTGLLKLFVEHKSHTTVDATGKNFSYPDIEYETHYSTRKKAKYVRLAYKGGKLSSEELIPPENYDKRPRVPMEQKENASDPLSFLVNMRMGLIAALKDGRKEFSFMVFDGRRLTEANFEIQETPRMIRRGEEKVAVVSVALTREFLAGFTKSELAKQDLNEPPLYIYFSRDERLIPLAMETSSWFGILTATLVKECRTGESCLLGIKE